MAGVLEEVGVQVMTLNRDLMYRIADAIEREPERFDMGDWIGETECGTTFCVAGWAVLLEKPELFMNVGTHRLPVDVLFEALRLLDPDPHNECLEELSRLFVSNMEADATDAAIKLRKFADAGQIDLHIWDPELYNENGERR